MDIMENENKKFVLCIENKDCDDLEIRKVYLVVPDLKSEADGYLRIIDESSEDYLYPKSYFIPLQLSDEIKEALSVSK
jgi:hypothetical protein